MDLPCVSALGREFKALLLLVTGHLMGLIAIPSCIESSSPYFWNVRGHPDPWSLSLTRIYSACEAAKGFHEVKLRNSAHGMNCTGVYTCKGYVVIKTAITSAHLARTPPHVLGSLLLQVKQEALPPIDQAKPNGTSTL